MSEYNPTIQSEVTDGHLYCSCGSRQTTVRYSGKYRGLMFGCETRSACRSQDEGCYPSPESAQGQIDFLCEKYGLVHLA
jgi:hypothetical protein